MVDSKNFQKIQIDEIYSIHFIYYPVKIINYGGVRSDTFPSDCMSEMYYNELLEKSKFLTNIKVNESSIKGSVRSELIRFTFKTSPLFGTDDHTNYALVDVTFPKTYPLKSPFISIKMTFPIHSDYKKRLTSRLVQITRNFKGKTCVFEVTMFVNEVMAKFLSEDSESLLDEMKLKDQSYYYRGSELETFRDHFDTNDEEETMYTQDEDVFSHEEEHKEILPEEDLGYKHSEIDFPIWSVQSITQAPIWYENFNKSDGQNEVPLGKSNKESFKSNLSKKRPIKTEVYKISPQASINSRDNEEQSRSVLDIDLNFTNESIKNLNAIKKSLNEFVSDSYDRYDRDFLENDYVLETKSHSLCSVRHILDQNLYHIKTFYLPTLCPYVNLSEAHVPTLFHSLRVKRRLMINEIIAKVSQLSKLEHNSICRYYQSWLEKKLDSSLVDQVSRLCDDILSSGSYSLLFKEGNLEEKMILLFKYSPMIGENYLYEMLLARKLYIQIQNFNGHTLRYEIENNSLYKNVDLIWRFMRHLLDVLAYLHHNNVFHQSLSLDNIYVHTDSYGTGVRVSEYGITHLARKLLSCEYECDRKYCDCKEYKTSMTNHLFQSHPYKYFFNSSSDISQNRTSIFDLIRDSKIQDPNPLSNSTNFLNASRIGSLTPLTKLKSSEFDNLDFEDTFDHAEAVQEDMFALGIIIFLMWHPPMDEKASHELLVKVVTSQTFPDYFVQSTPPIIVTTLSRLLSRLRRPTAEELLTETLVPPVVDIYMYKQYLRKLENPMSEESIDALSFLLSRNWKSDVLKYRHESTLELMTHSSYVIDSLERFMRNRGVIIRPPLPLQVKTQETNDLLLGIDETNTVFSVGGSIRQSLLRSFELYSEDDSGIGVKQFSVGDVFDQEKCVTEAICSITMKIESDEDQRVAGKKGSDYKNFDDNCILMVSSQVDLIVIGMESIIHLDLCDHVFFTLTFQSLIVDFLSIALDIDIEMADHVFRRLQVTDINEFTFNIVLKENSKEMDSQSKKLLDILSNRFGLISGLKRLHLHVLNCKIPENYRSDFESLYQEILKLCPDQNYEDNWTRVESNEVGDALVYERYYKKMLYMMELSRMLQILSLDKFCFIEFVMGAYYTELCDYNENFPFFLGSLSDEGKFFVMTGGSYGTNTSFLESSNVSRVAHFDLQYFLDDLIKLSLRSTKKIEGYTITPTKADTVDVVITCQTTKLLPAAASIANKLIDAGLSCECRAIPLILTSDFNLRLRMVDSIRARVHLQKFVNTNSEEMQTEKLVNYGVERSNNEEDPDDKSHINILYHLEPINGSFGQARRIDNELALVHFVIGHLT